MLKIAYWVLFKFIACVGFVSGLFALFNGDTFTPIILWIGSAFLMAI